MPFYDRFKKIFGEKTKDEGASPKTPPKLTELEKEIRNLELSLKKASEVCKKYENKVKEGKTKKDSLDYPSLLKAARLQQKKLENTIKNLRKVVSAIKPSRAASSKSFIPTLDLAFPSVPKDKPGKEPVVSSKPPIEKPPKPEPVPDKSKPSPEEPASVEMWAESIKPEPVAEKPKVEAPSRSKSVTMVPLVTREDWHYTVRTPKDASDKKCSLIMKGAPLRSEDKLVNIMAMVKDALTRDEFKDVFRIRGSQELIQNTLLALYTLKPDYSGVIEVQEIKDRKALPLETIKEKDQSLTDVLDGITDRVINLGKEAEDLLTAFETKARKVSP